MNLIKLDAIASTNTYLLQLSKEKVLTETTIVIANSQTQGKGQMGTSWYSETGKTLTFSIFKRFEDFKVENQNSISQAVALGVLEALKHFKIPQITIKWPNDIMSYSKKMAGILIENQVKKTKIVSSVVGIGLNVNDINFKTLPNATSMQSKTKVNYNLNEVFDVLIKKIIQKLELLDAQKLPNVVSDYEDLLFKREKVMVFESAHGELFNGIIKGISKTGKLLVLLENDIIKSFKLKEIKMLLS